METLLEGFQWNKGVVVLTVPMRNGNIAGFGPCGSYCIFGFLPYLWGMETTKKTTILAHIWLCSYRTYEEWKRGGVTGAQAISVCSYRTYEEWKQLLSTFVQLGLKVVLTVPMRNGNRYEKSIGETVINGSYRTYEEWKQYNTNCNISNFKCSYRTYEEWKLWIPRRSYRWTSVLTVPMRNGNSKKL